MQPRLVDRRLRPSAPPLVCACSLIVLLAAPALRAQSLDGSRESLLRQNLGAQEEGLIYLRTTADVRAFAERGLLVPVRRNADLDLAGDEVSFPVARPEVKAFVEWLAHDYRARCGEPLVVTSLTRPITRQPHNASAISVHPTGMAVDLRRSDRTSCRRWLEGRLLSLEGKGVIEATREHWPPHYHVAVFADPLRRFLHGQPLQPPAALPEAQIAQNAAPEPEAVEVLTPAAPGATPSVAASEVTEETVQLAELMPLAPASPVNEVARASYGSRHHATTLHSRSARSKSHRKSAKPASATYRVGRGDNLWRIARRHGVSVDVIERANGLHSAGELKAGQVLSIPTVR